MLFQSWWRKERGERKGESEETHALKEEEGERGESEEEGSGERKGREGREGKKGGRVGREGKKEGEWGEKGEGGVILHALLVLDMVSYPFPSFSAVQCFNFLDNCCLSLRPCTNFLYRPTFS